MSTAAPEPEEEPESASPSDMRRRRDGEGSASAMKPEEWGALSNRIREVREAEAEMQQLKGRLAAISHAFVLVFDVDTEDEAVYIMDEEEQPGVVLAFETQHDASEYARALELLDTDSAIPEWSFSGIPADSDTSVQALDLEVLVVSSREAEFRVAMVFDGDLSLSVRSSGQDEQRVPNGLPPSDDGVPGLGGALFPGTGADDQLLECVTLAVSMVPEDMYKGRSSADFIDPAVDEMFVLLQDAGTADAQYLSLTVNHTECIACFRTEDLALRFCRALMTTGVTLPVPRAVMVNDLRDEVRLGVPGRNVCIVDSLAEMHTSFIITDESGEVVGGMEGGCISAGGCSVSKTLSVCGMLDRLFDEESLGWEDGV